MAASKGKSDDPSKVKQAVVEVGVDELIPGERNPRKGQTALIVESLLEFGQHRPIVVQRSTNRVIAWNHLLRAAKTLGWEKVGVLFVDDDDEMALRRAIADNAVGDKSQWDKDLLAELLQETGPVPGFDDREIQKLIDSVEDSAEEEDEPVFPITAHMGEAYDYVVIVADNETDAAYLATKFDLQKEKSYKSKNVGVSHVLTVDRMREVLGE